MKTAIAATMLLISAQVAPAFAETPASLKKDVDSLACEVVRERKDWYAAMQHTETRWGLPIEHQLALISEDWDLTYKHVPTKWRPNWTRAAKEKPGIAPGFFASTWKQYEHQRSGKRPSTNAFADTVDFMGWYFATLAPPENISPFDPVAQYILWRQGPDGFRSNTWRNNLWLRSGADDYAARVRMFTEDLTDCDLDRVTMRERIQRFIFSKEQEWN